MKKHLKNSVLITAIFFMSLLSAVCCAKAAAVTPEAYNTVESIRVEWNECDGAYYYEVYRQTDKKGEKLLLSKVQSTFYEDTEAEQGKTYSYTVVPAFADHSTAKESDAVKIYRISATAISKSGSQRNGIYIEWKGVKNAKGYNVYRKSAEDGDWNVVARLGSGKRSYLDGEVSPGQYYSYCVKAFSGEYEGAAANEKQLSYISYPVVKNIENTENGIKLSWEEASDVAYYFIYRKTGEDGSFKKIALLDADCTEYEDKAAPAGELCTYYIRGADSNGNEGSFDRELSVKCVIKSEITALVNSLRGISLYWSKSEGCQGYAIYRKILGEEKWKLRGTVYGENKLSAVDTKVDNGTVYLYTVRAFNSRVRAVYDEDGTGLRFYSAPQKLKIDYSDAKGRTISWQKVDGVENYAVYRKEGDSSWTFLGITAESSFTDSSAKKKYTYGVEAYEGSVLKSAMAEITSK